MIPVFDNHVHLDPNGEGTGAAVRFKKAGGTHLLLCHKPYPVEAGTPAEYFRAQYQVTLELAKKCRDEIDGLTILVGVGPYPGELVQFMKKYDGDLAKAKSAMIDGVNVAREMAMEKKVNVIGEIGRPHYPVDASVMEASNDIMTECFIAAKEASCPVMLHTETFSDKTYAAVNESCRISALPQEKVIKHFSKPAHVGKFGTVVSSVLCRDGALKRAMARDGDFLLETDFLDESKRPGVVLDIETVPRLYAANREEHADVFYKVFQELPTKLYGPYFEL